MPICATRAVNERESTAGGEISGGGSENFIEKFIGLFFVDKKDVRRVHNVAVNGQFDGVVEMRQGLNTGDQLDAVL